MATAYGAHSKALLPTGGVILVVAGNFAIFDNRQPLTAEIACRSVTMTLNISDAAHITNLDSDSPDMSIIALIVSYSVAVRVFDVDILESNIIVIVVSI